MCINRSSIRYITNYRRQLTAHARASNFPPDRVHFSRCFRLYPRFAWTTNDRTDARTDAGDPPQDLCPSVRQSRSDGWIDDILSLRAVVTVGNGRQLDQRVREASGRGSIDRMDRFPRFVSI